MIDRNDFSDREYKAELKYMSKRILLREQENKINNKLKIIDVIVTLIMMIIFIVALILIYN